MKTAIQQIIVKLEQRVIDSTKPDALTKRTGDYRIGLKHAIDECEQSIEIEKQYAQQQSCEFGEWLDAYDWRRCSTNSHDWININDMDKEIKTTAELYEQWKGEAK